ncbi:MAG: hypothetical protein HGA25_03445, partial [Clostridiales bacterium]|nr:hypothetical protein [Clostridiales bacterium]
NNTCVNAGGGWGHAQRPDPNGAHIMLYNNDATTSSFFIMNNIFCNSTEWGVRWTRRDNLGDVIMDYNCWFETSGNLARIENNYDCVALAHNLDDRIETILINLVRGTGLTGMTGIKPLNNKIIRPLLFAIIVRKFRKRFLC